MTTVCTNLIYECSYEKLPGQISGGGDSEFPGDPPATCLE